MGRLGVICSIFLCSVSGGSVMSVSGGSVMSVIVVSLGLFYYSIIDGVLQISISIYQ